jgi:DNA-binding NarL/FixJ family response regulator
MGLFSALTAAALLLATARPGRAWASAAFNQTLKLQGISFHLQSSGEGSEQQLTITTSGAKPPIKPIRQSVSGQVVGAVLGRPVRIALLDGSLLERQFWLLLFFLTPSWELVAIAENLEDLRGELADDKVPTPDLVIADPTGLCRRCPVSCLGDLESCPLLSLREAIEGLPPVLLHLRKGDMSLACRAMSAGVKGLQLHGRGLMGLRDAALAVVSGNVWIDPDLSSDLLGMLRAAVSAPEAAANGDAEMLLSPREREVLQGLGVVPRWQRWRGCWCSRKTPSRPTCAASTKNSASTTARIPCCGPALRGSWDRQGVKGARL